MHFVCGDGLHGVLPDEAERIKRRLLVIRAERDYDIAGEQAQRVQMLYTMYLECLVTGHALQKRGRRAVS